MSEKTPSVSRRGFVAGAGAAVVGAGLVGGLAGCAPKSASEDEEEAAKAGVEGKGEWIPTTCNMCFNSCSILAHVVDGVVVELKGNPDSPIGNGHICAKGAAGIMQLYDPNRITKPLKRTNPEKGFDQDPGWEEISWDEAYDILAEKITSAMKNDPNSVAGSSMVASQIGSLIRATAFGAAFGVNNGMISDICGAGVHICEFLMTSCGNSQPDYKYCNYLIQFGTQAGTATRHGFNMTAETFARRRKEGLRFVSFDPHMSAGAEKADIWVPIRPGSDAAAALAMANVLVHELGIYDRDYLVKRTNACALVDPDTKRLLRAADTNKSLYWDESTSSALPYDEASAPALEGIFEVDGKSYTTAFDVYKEHIASMTPEWAEEITTVPAATIRQIAKEFGEAACIGETIDINGVTLPYRPVAVDVFSGLSRHKHSILNVWSCLMLNELVGSANSVGGFIGFASACNGWTDDNDNASFHPTIWEEDGFIESNSLMIARPNSFYKTIREREYTLGKRDMLGIQPLSEDGHFVHVTNADPEKWHVTPIDVLFWYACNPVRWWGNSDQEAEALKKMDYVIGCDLFLNDTSYFTDLMLPEACYLERFDPLPHMFLNHRHIGGIDTPWTVAIWQPVVEAKDGAPGYMDLYANIVDRAGANEAFIERINGLFRVKPEYSVPTDKKLDTEAFVNSVLKSNIDEEHDLQWFREHNGVYTRERSVDEVYIWNDEVEGRIPFYWDFMLEAKEKVEAALAETDIPWDTSDYIPLPEWRPGMDFYPKEDPEFDLFPVYYTNSQNTDTWTVENPWINEVNENDGVTYCLEMNSATAAAKGLASGDEVVLTSTAGYSIEGRLVVTDGIHPECVSSVVGTWNAKTEHMTIAKGKGVDLVNLIPGDDPERLDHVVSAFDQLIRVKIAKK